MRIRLSPGVMATLLICFSSALPANVRVGLQAPISNPKQLPLSSHSPRRPKLSLENGLAIAKSQLKNTFEADSYWLHAANFTLYGDSKVPDRDKAPCWHFTWLSDESGQAPIEMVVFMNGDSMRVPTF
jgi:hypothetical protein